MYFESWYYQCLQNGFQKEPASNHIRSCILCVFPTLPYVSLGAWYLTQQQPRSVRLLKPGTRVLVFAPRNRPDDAGAEAAPCMSLCYLFSDATR